MKELPMAKCAACDKSFMMGGVKDGEVRYCSAACRFQSFFRRFDAALSQAAATNPQPLPTPPPAATSQDAIPGEFEHGTPVDGSKDFLVLLLGWGGIAVVAGIIYWLVDLVKYPFHSQTFWFVIPIGAVLCGMVAGAGFWLGLRGLDRRPKPLIYLAAGWGGFFGYLLIYVLMWWLLEFDGAKVRDEVRFLDFLQYVVEHQRIRVGRGPGEGFEVGKFGYVRFVINMVGFGLGVIATVAIAGGKAYCPNCQRYLKTVVNQVRASSDPEAAATALHPVIVGIVAGRLQEALDLHAVSSDGSSQGYWSTTLTIEACPGCGTHQATLTATVPADRGRQKVEGFVFKGSCREPVRLTS
jgi:hypothetical protein